jgi:hypothetical protein
MSKQDRPDERASSEEEAELRAFRRIASRWSGAIATNWPPRSWRSPIQRGRGRERKMTVCEPGRGPRT